MDISKIMTKIELLKAETQPGAITPNSLGNLLAIIAEILNTNSDSILAELINLKLSNKIFEDLINSIIQNGYQGSIAYQLILLQGSELYRENQGFVAKLGAFVFENGKDITNTYSSSQLIWERESENPLGDPDWNLTHRNIGQFIIISTDDLVGDTTIRLTFLDKSGQIKTIKNYKF